MGVTAGEQHVLSGQQVRGDHVQWDGCVLEPVEPQVGAEQLTQATVTDQVVVPAEEAQQAAQGASREDVAAAKGPPHLA